MVAISPIKQRKFTPDVVHQGTPYRRPQALASVDGAITLIDGQVFITKGTAAALTLAAPPVDMDGAILSIISTTAAAHTVTQTTPGFNSGSTASDVATFGGAIGDNMQCVAYQGAWLATHLRNVTLG